MILRRTADNLNTFYLGNRQEFENKSERYLEITMTYKFLLNKESAMNSTSYAEQVQHDFKEMIESMNMKLDNLGQQKKLENETVKKLRLDASQVKLPSVYFLPDVSRVSQQILIICIYRCSFNFYSRKMKFH